MRRSLPQGLPTGTYGDKLNKVVVIAETVSVQDEGTLLFYDKHSQLIMAVKDYVYMEKK